MGSYSPLTGKSIPHPSNSIASAKLIDEWKRAFGIDISQELEGIREIERYRCPDSGLFFFKPNKSCGSSRLYEALGKFPWYYPKDKWEYQRALEIIPKGAKIIEIGCGSGDFLEHAKVNHPDVCGLDINPEAIRTAADKGFQVFCEPIEVFCQKGFAQFDALCAFQLLEHLPHPLDFLEDALHLIRKDGLLIVATPNAESYLRYQYTLLDMPPHHMSQWSSRAYKFLETLLPVRVDSVSFEPLSKPHAPHFAKSTADRILKNLGIASLTGSKIVERVLCKVGEAGLLSPFIKGQGMLVVMRKTADSPRSMKAAKRHSTSRFANLGCGHRWHPDWRNFDLVPSDPSVEAMDLLADWDLPGDFFEVVYSSHVMEHLPRELAPYFLKNCRRILKPGGILRLVVPDLEGICREYLSQLEAAQNGIPGADLKHRWMTLELLDQLVRTRSGGLMARLWASNPLPEKDYIVSRFGEDAKYWIEKLQQTSPARNDSKGLFEGLPSLPPTDAVNFRQQGEIHQWMYDVFSLSELLRECGFIQITKVDALTSGIPGFTKFQLDANSEGISRKPDSLYIEARKSEAKI